MGGQRRAYRRRGQPPADLRIRAFQELIAPPSVSPAALLHVPMNQFTSPRLLAVSLLLLAGCHLPFGVGRTSRPQHKGVQLAQVESADGTRSAWRLYPGLNDAPASS